MYEEEQQVIIWEKGIKGGAEKELKSSSFTF